MATIAQRRAGAIIEWLGHVVAFIPVLAVFLAVWGGLSLWLGVWGVALGWLPALWLAGVVGYVWPLALIGMLFGVYHFWPVI